MDVLEIENPWWKDGMVSRALAPAYRRAVFGDIKKLIPMKQITVISGLRRVGKSTAMYQLIEDLLSSGAEPKHILYSSFDDDIIDIPDVLERYAQITGVDYKKDKCFVFLDEIQKLKNWSGRLKLIYDALPNLKFIISGSGSFPIERGSRSNLVGRHFFVIMEPLSFREFLELKKSKIDIKKPRLWESELKKEFGKYLFRPFPETVGMEELTQVRSYIKDNVIEKITRSDIAEKFKDANEDLLRVLIDNFYSNQGAYLNMDTLARDLKVSKNTLIPHIYYLEYSYLFRRVRNFRPSTRATSRKLQRIYPFHWSLSFGWNGNISTETIVASLLDAKYYWREGRREVDFIKNANAAKIVPIEVKETKKINSEDIYSLRYFMSRFNVNKGVLIYNGEQETIKEGMREIKLTPAWKAFLDA